VGWPVLDTGTLGASLVHPNVSLVIHFSRSAPSVNPPTSQISSRIRDVGHKIGSMNSVLASSGLSNLKTPLAHRSKYELQFDRVANCVVAIPIADRESPELRLGNITVLDGRWWLRSMMRSQMRAAL